MSNLKIAIIVGSTRPGRNGKAVADWVASKAKSRTAADYGDRRVDKPVVRTRCTVPTEQPTSSAMSLMVLQCQYSLTISWSRS